MTPSLSELNQRVEDAATVLRTQRRGSVLHVYMRDEPREYEVRIQEDEIEVIAIDTMGGGKIGGVIFNDEAEAAAHIRSV